MGRPPDIRSGSLEIFKTLGLWEPSPPDQGSVSETPCWGNTVEAKNFSHLPQIGLGSCMVPTIKWPRSPLWEVRYRPTIGFHGFFKRRQNNLDIWQTAKLMIFGFISFLFCFSFFLCFVVFFCFCFLFFFCFFCFCFFVFAFGLSSRPFVTSTE